MLGDVRQQLGEVLQAALAGAFPSADLVPAIELETPADSAHGDLACNVALKSARVLRKPPMALAETFVPLIQQALSVSPCGALISGVECKHPGFINFRFSPQAAYDILAEVLREQEGFGRLSLGHGTKVQIEFVSANPTGPLSVAHARQAAVGDALVNILNALGYEARKEYYVNDEGNQINILGRSIRFRALEHFGEKIDFPEECYQGEYIADIAGDFLKDKGITSLEQLKTRDALEFNQYGVDYLMAVIRQELEDFGVHFDIWSHQSQVADLPKIETLLKDLTAQGHLYEQDGALWFRTTAYGDDKDRVVRKSDGSYTYFTPDIVYHQNKFARGFQRVYNIWGPDHHGYIPRLRAAVQALGQPAEALQVLIVQLATIYRNGQPVSMSTRRGQYISLREVMTEVGVDAARYFFMMRHINAHLDFDLELAKKETAENPVYYIQYAHARICSILEKARETGLTIRQSGFQQLQASEELGLAKKIGTLPDILALCGQEMDPFALVNYLLELAACFHKFYDQHRVIDPQEPELSSERLGLIDASRVALANGLRLLGIRAPQKM